MNTISEKIIGTWQLVYSIEIDADGRKIYPFGEKAIGYLMYNINGTMAVQICRNPYTISNLTTITENYLAYFGNYEIDVKEELVRHFVKGHLLPHCIGKTLERKYAFFDNKMSLKPWDDTNREILWQRVST